jgi:hypothetical protein
MIRRPSILLCALVFFGLGSAAAHATTFTIVSATITATPTVLGAFVATPQTPGSLTNELIGSLEVEMLPGSIQFAGGSGGFDPLPGPFAPGNAPADFAGIVNLLGSDAFGAGRDFTLTYVSGPIAVDGAGAFAPGGALISTGGSFDYDAPVLGFSGSILVAGASGPNVASGTGSLVVSGGSYLLTLPIDVTLPFFVDGSEFATFRYQGTVTATAPVPEPSSLVLAGIGLAILARRGRKPLFG